MDYRNVSFVYGDKINWHIKLLFINLLNKILMIFPMSLIMNGFKMDHFKSILVNIYTLTN